VLTQQQQQQKEKKMVKPQQQAQLLTFQWHLLGSGCRWKMRLVALY
jgi:hypothetical protein